MPADPELSPQERMRLISYIDNGLARAWRRGWTAMSAREWAALLGVSRNTLIAWEAGRVRPRGAHAVAYLQLLDSLNDVGSELRTDKATRSIRESTIAGRELLAADKAALS